MSEQSLSIRISREELAVVLRLLDLPSLPGAGDQFLAGVPDDKQATMLLAGRHGLLARGWLEETADPVSGEVRFTLNPVLLALVSECGRATTLTVVTRNGRTTPPVTWYLHRGPNLYVIHRMVEDGVHEFVGSVSAEEMQHTICDLFPAVQDEIRPDMPGEPLAFHMPQALLDAIIVKIRGEQASAATGQLQAAGVAPAAAQAFTAALHALTANSLLARLELADEPGMHSTANNAFSLIETPSSLWMLRPGETGKETLLQVEQISRLDFTKLVGQLVV